MNTPKRHRRRPTARSRRVAIDAHTEAAASLQVPPDMTSFVQSLFEMFSAEMKRRQAEEDAEASTAAHQEDAGTRLAFGRDSGFLLAASHRLRTRLATVLGTAVTLEQHLDALQPEESRELIGRLARNARELDGLLGNIVDVERLQRGSIEPLRYKTNVLDLIRELLRRIDDGVPAVALEGAPYELAIDTAMVQRIVANLVRNARQHTPAGTAVWVRVEPMPPGVQIAVEDDGPGVPPTLRELMFEPFSRGPTARPHDPGLGVGLTLVSRFAELHGGRAWIEDRPGGGACVKVVLLGGDE